jgi:conjugal transfer pilus assembly protein TraV
VLLALFAAFATSACTNLSGLGGESKFKCAVPDGVPCMSMSEVDSSYRAGVLPGQHRPPPVGLGGPTAPGSPAGAAGARGDSESFGDISADDGNAGAARPVQPVVAGAPTAARWLPQRVKPMAPRQAVADRESVPTASAVPMGAIRTEPTIIRIWIAPWEDADGDLNDQGYVYLQIDAGRWLIEHNREQIRRSFAPAQAGAAPSQPARPLVGAASPKAGAQQ